MKTHPSVSCVGHVRSLSRSMRRKNRGCNPWDILHCRACQNGTFTIGESVTYRIPVDIQSATQYQWSQHVGIVTGYDSIYKLVQIQPDDQDEGIVQVPRVYVKTTQHIESEEEKGVTA